MHDRRTPHEQILQTALEIAFPVDIAIKFLCKMLYINGNASDYKGEGQQVKM